MPAGDESDGSSSSAAGWRKWHVVGSHPFDTQWALRQGWGGRPVRQEQAQGMLVAALGLLAAHFGLDGQGAPSWSTPEVARSGCPA